MINDKGERVAGPKAATIPPHMLEGMTSAGQKKLLGKWKRAESREAAASGAASTPAAKTAKAARKSSAPRRAAKNSSTKATE